MGRVPCCSKVGLKRGAWTAEEDEILRKYIDSHGQGDWRNLPLNAGLKRCRKSCRLRWMNYLRPDIKRGDFSDEEEDLIIRLHKLLGNRWSLIAGRLPGRTDNEIKNYWNTHLSRKLLYLQKSAEPPTKLLRARKHKSSSKPTVETKDVISSPLSEKVEDKRNDVEAEIENCISSWEEPLRFENFTNEQHLTKHENLEDLYGLDSVDVNWIERGSEDVMEMERFSVETQPCMYWDEYCEFITVY